MIISDLSVFEAAEESAHIQGGFLPVFTGPNGNVAGNGTNNAQATASGVALNPFGPGTGSIIGVSSSSTQADTRAVVVLGGGSQSDSASSAAIGFVPGPNGAPLLIRQPLVIANP